MALHQRSLLSYLMGLFQVHGATTAAIPALAQLIQRAKFVDEDSLVFNFQFVCANDTAESACDTEMGAVVSIVFTPEPGLPAVLAHPEIKGNSRKGYQCIGALDA